MASLGIKTGNTTPMMQQFLAIKAKHTDCIIFYRMGDFYELFFDDAIKASEALDITLTKRGRHNGVDIPMCGVPVHSSEIYLMRLIKKGYRVAVCEQTEDPAEAKKRGAKSVVKRQVVRIVTPGTITEDTLLDANTNSYLCAICSIRETFSVAWTDVSTGQFTIQSASLDTIPTILTRIAPKEILLPQKMLHIESLFEMWEEYKSSLTPLPESRFDSINGQGQLERIFHVSSLESFGDFTKADLAAAGMLIDYIELTQVGKLPRLNPPKKILPHGYMEIDNITRRSLEIHTTQTGSRKLTLLDSIDQTKTGAGARLLSQWLASPLNTVEAIQGRLECVQNLIEQESVCHKIRDILKCIPDLDRSLSRISLGRGNPRDLSSIKNGLKYTGTMRSLLAVFTDHMIKECAENFGVHDVLVDKLESALRSELPNTIKDGGVIKKGFSPELDKIRILRDENRRIIATLENKYREISGVDTLKIKHNNVLQYFIEVTARHADKMADTVFLHRQTMTGAIRYTTVELSDVSKNILNARDKAIATEEEIFHALQKDVICLEKDICTAARAFATVDVLTNLAVLAKQNNWVRPTVNNSTDFSIVEGRHPIVERALTQQDRATFTANSCFLEGEKGKIWLLTGPNMAGKSTFLRQNALIVILAQMGCFVPAKACTIGIVDRVFSRIGASDDLARGKSTFMVEMVETATILNQATEKSLVILDEIGRGTATYDGLSIAWACIEHLCTITKCRGLFATHYHELNALTQTMKTLKSYSMHVKEWQNKIVFLHSVKSGCADRSYGIHVGKLAGLPQGVLDRAQAILETLENTGKKQKATDILQNLPLFSPTKTTEPNKPEQQKIQQMLIQADVDEMSPRQALEFLYTLKSLVKDTMQ